MSDKDKQAAAASDNNFEELLKSLQDTADENATLAKALPAENPEDEDGDDENIEAAADDGDEAADENEGDDEAEGKEKPMAKSMTTMIDGEEYEAVDATEMLKSLTDRLDGTDTVLAKALSTTVAALQDQSKLIKSLSDKVEKLAGQGRGRKTVLTVHEKTTSQDVLAKSQQTEQEPSREQILAKALGAQKAGKLTGGDVCRVEAALNHGFGVPAEIMQRLS